MRNTLKWAGIGLGGLVALLALLVIGLLIYGQFAFKRTYANRPLYPITADASPAGIARGEYLMNSVMACVDACHKAPDGSLSGMVEAFSDGAISGVFAVPNLTSDATGLAGWSDAEIARAIREGVDKDGAGLMIMPAYNYHVMSDQDVAAVVGYLRRLPPVQHEVPPFQASAVAKAMAAVGMFGPSPVGAPITAAQTAPAPGTAEHGGYLVALGACRDCHQGDLAGGPVPFAEPGAAPAANLTPAGDLAAWTEADFIRAMRNGLRPDGATIDPTVMPWPFYGGMTDADLTDIFAYLRTLSPVSR